jgi:hypothetical protein
MPIVESNITLNFPDNNYFRFENCQGYKDIQNNFKEMDACWYDQANDILYIIELKDWQDGKLIEENDPNVSQEKITQTRKDISQHNINVLLKKSVDSLSMFLSVLLAKSYASKIQACMPFSITNSTAIKLLSIINWANPDPSYIAFINTEYKAKFKPYSTLFDIKAYLVLTKNQAMAKFSWIS